MDTLVSKIDNWINDTLESHYDQMVSCKQFSSYFDGYFTEKFLSNSFYVICSVLPKPDFTELREMGFGDFIDDKHDGVTYKNCYFIKPQFEENLYLHLHELVHVAQWNILGVEKFIKAYIDELLKYGYDDAPLEQMAKAFEYNYSIQANPIDIVDTLESELNY